VKENRAERGTKNGSPDEPQQREEERGRRHHRHPAPKTHKRQRITIEIEGY
jgi:hypothetical protein